MARNRAGLQLVKLLIGAGQATPGPPVGPALGSRGVKSTDFCKVGWLVGVASSCPVTDMRTRTRKQKG